MATANINSKRSSVVSSAFLYPHLQQRISKNDTYPKHKQMGVWFGDEITMHFHTAGTDVIWEIPVLKAALNKRLIRGLEPLDALQLGLFYEEQREKSKFKYFQDEIGKLEATIEKLTLTLDGRAS